MTQILKIYKKNEHAQMPKYSTEMSAAFDIHACLPYGASVKGFTTNNEDIETFGISLKDNEQPFVEIPHNWRYLIPTGIILDIPENHYVEVFSRSGNSIKKGLTLINSVGIIDEDYTQELFIPIINLSQQRIRIHHGDRIAQGILKVATPCVLFETLERPKKDSDRNGGFGSTGV